MDHRVRIVIACCVLVVACAAESDEDSPFGDGQGDSAGSSGGRTTGISSTSGDSAITQSGTGSVDTSESDASTGGSVTDSTTAGGPGGGSTGDDVSGSTGGGEAFPIDCDAVDMPVWVETGGGYSTIQDGVDAAPPGGTVWVCSGAFLGRVTSPWPVHIIAEGPDLVTVQGNLDTLPVFELAASSTLHGMTITGGSQAVFASIGPDEPSRFEDLRVTGSSERGMVIVGEHGSATANRVELNRVEIRNINTSYPFGAGVYFTRVDATLTDCSIENNLTSGFGGGMYVLNSDVTFTGGLVRSNTAYQGGGGAYVDHTSGASSTLTIINSDWGTGAAHENEDEDVECEMSGTNSYPFLDDNTTATCQVAEGLVSACCDVESVG